MQTAGVYKALVLQPLPCVRDYFDSGGFNSARRGNLTCQLCPVASTSLNEARVVLS